MALRTPDTARAPALVAGLGALVLGAAAHAVPWRLDAPVVKLKTTLELDDETRQRRNDHREERTLRSRNQADISTRGWVYHPALVTFDLDLRPEFEREDITRDPGLSGDGSTAFLGLRADSTWFQYKPVSVDIYGLRERERINNSLSTDTDTRTTEFGGRVRSKKAPWPLELSLSKRLTTTETLFRSREVTREVSLRSRNRGRLGQTDVESRYALRDVLASQGKDFINDFSSQIVNRYQYGGARDVLTSRLNFHDQTSRLNGTDKSFLVRTDVQAQHTPNLHSRWGIGYEDLEQVGLELERVSTRGEMTHQLYENLLTTASFDANREQRDTGHLDDTLASLALRYTRAVPFGRILGNYSRDLNFENNRLRSVLLPVRDESITFTGTTREFLAEDDALATTLVVTDGTGTVVFARDIDYVVTIEGNRVAIARTIFGSIASGDTVLVDYAFNPGPSAFARTTTDTLGLGAEFGEWLKLRWQVRRVTEDVIRGFKDDLIDDLEHLYELELNLGPTTTRVEYEDIDSDSSPSKEWRVSERLAVRPLRSLSLSAGTELTNTEFLDSGNNENRLRSRAGLRWRIGRWWLGTQAMLTADADHELVRGDVQETDTLTARADFRWRYGAWYPRLELRFNRERDRSSGDSRDRFRAMFEVERRFDFSRLNFSRFLR